jgi:N-hydroxyarylamine O-acetyltransferase
MTTEQIQHYFNRIAYNGELTPDVRSLCELQRTHLLHVPFENLDIHRNTPINLDLEKLYEKIVVNQRGGFCYELNGLFYELLKGLGYNVMRLAARVYNQGVLGPKFDHLALMVEMDGMEYLTDVGFGEFSFHPLRIEVGRELSDVRGRFIIEPFSEKEFRVNKMDGNEKIPKYTFEKGPFELIDFNEMCSYHQSNPNSYFTQKKYITMPTERGRVTLFEDKMTIKEGDMVTEQKVNSEQAFNVLLQRHFDIIL